MKISIITPSFNQGLYIRRAIDSVIDQRGDFELEYLVIDAFSEDGTVEILKDYEERLRGNENVIFRFLVEKDNGQSEGINKGVDLVSGDIVAYLNADDYYNRNALQKVAYFFRVHRDLYWAFGKCHIVNKEGKIIRKWITRYKNFFLSRYSYTKLLMENFISQPSTFWRIELSKELGLLNESEHLCMDYEYWLRIGLKYKPGYIDEYLSYFCVRNQSKGYLNYEDQFNQGYKYAKLYAKKYGKNWPIWIHQLNVYKIIGLYKIMRWLKK